MKRTAITLALLAAATLAFTSTSAFAWNNYRYDCYGMRNHGPRMMQGGYGMMGGRYNMMTNWNNNLNSDAYKAFRKETATIRTGLAADEAELDALMAGTNPDPQRARALSESISAKQSQLGEAAAKYNIQPNNGWYCNRWQ